jgi:hypothetical protein
VGRIFGRRLEQTREHRRFGQRHLLDRFAEVEFRRRLDAEGAAAHIDPVEVELENLPFGEMVLQPKRQKSLVDFAHDRALVGKEQVFGELLGDRGAALHDAGRTRVHAERARGSDHVYAEMLVKAPILRREHGLDQIVRIFLQWHGVVVLDAAGAHERSVTIVKSHREIRAFQPVFLVDELKGRYRERQRDDRAAERHRQRFAGELHPRAGEAGHAEASHEGGKVLIGLARLAGRLEHRGIDEGIELQQKTRAPLDDGQRTKFIPQSPKPPAPEIRSRLATLPSFEPS